MPIAAVCTVAPDFSASSHAWCWVRVVVAPARRRPRPRHRAPRRCSSRPLPGPDPAADDVRSGWFAIPKDTHTVSLAESEKGDSVSLRKVEQACYRSGYQGLYADGRNDGVLVGAFTYNNPAVALQVADSWSARNAAQITHATLLHPPSSVVGGRVSAWRGETHQGRAMVPVYMVMWSHGNAIGGVFLFGHKASAGQAYRIAAAQDARLAAA